MKRPSWLKVPTTGWGQLFYGMLTQFTYFFIVSANFRAIAIGLKCATVVTDALICAQAFAVGKLAIDKEEARTWWVGAGETVGGAAGSVLSIVVTQKLFGR